MFDRAEPHEYVAYFGARLALAIFGALPLKAASDLGGWIGRTIGPRLGVRKHALANLRMAMPELTAEQQQAILVGMWDNLGRVVAEYAHLGDIRISTPEQAGNVEIVGGEHLAAIRDSGKPAIIFGAHYGNWEVASLVGAHYRLSMVQVYRAANNPLTEELLQKLREPVGGRHVPKGMQAARELLKALKQNEHLCILVDQKLSTGIPVPFFGHDAMTAPAVAELALRAQCPLVPIRVERLGGTQFRFIVEQPFLLTDTGNRDADVFNALVRINGMIESWIRARPDHWFWVHKRWKR